MTAQSTRALLARFLPVGGAGFLVDAGVFQLLFTLGHGAMVARVVSTVFAVTVTWYLNRNLVFKTRIVNRSAPEFARYVVVQAAGLAVNLGVFVALLATIEALQRVPIVALCGGAAAAITFNFLGARYWAFRHEAPKR